MHFKAENKQNIQVYYTVVYRFDRLVTEQSEIVSAHVGDFIVTLAHPEIHQSGDLS